MSAPSRLGQLRCVRCGRSLTASRTCVVAFPAEATDEVLAWDCVRCARLDGWPWLASEPPRTPSQEITS